MLLFLLRHGIAEDQPARGLDADRALTAEGRRKLGLVLDRAASAAVRPDLILTSPYLRAAQTAQAAAASLNPKVKPVDSHAGHCPILITVLRACRTLRR